VRPRHDPGEPAGFINKDFPTTAAARDRQAAASLRARLTAELATVRDQLGRVDAKANTLLTVCGVLLAAAVSVLAGNTSLPAAAAATGWLATALVAAAVLLLLLAVRPRLNGFFGFVAFAEARDGQDLLDMLRRGGGDPLADAAGALHCLAVMLRAKYRAIRHASTLLGAGLGAAAVTAVLAAWAR
jgi:hypothetical protein